MKFEMDQQFYNEMNMFAKFFLFTGLYMVHIGMKLAGLEDGESELEVEKDNL